MDDNESARNFDDVAPNVRGDGLDYIGRKRIDLGRVPQCLDVMSEHVDVGRELGNWVVFP